MLRWDRDVSVLFHSADSGEVVGGKVHLLKALDNGAWGRAIAHKEVGVVEGAPPGFKATIPAAVLRGFAAAVTSGDSVVFKYHNGGKVAMVVAQVERSGPRRPILELILAARSAS